MHCMGSASGISSLQGIIGNPVSLEESVKTDAQFLSLSQVMDLWEGRWWLIVSHEQHVLWMIMFNEQMKYPTIMMFHRKHMGYFRLNSRINQNSNPEKTRA